MSTVLGIISGTGLLFYAIFTQSGLAVFLNPPALMIVLGGTLAAIFISFPLPRVLKVVGTSLQIFKKDIEKPLWAIATIVRLAVKARQKSLMSLEKDAKIAKNRFLSMGLEMIVDGHPGDIIRDVLETELDFIQIRHRGGAHILQTSAKFAPAFGLIGTLIGLVAMLQSLGGGGTEGIKKMGEGMSVAMITTFYGALLANLIFSPVAEKLRARSDDESLTTTIIIEGILMIQGGMNPRMIEKKLNSFLPPYLRTSHFDRIAKQSRASRKVLETTSATAATDDF